MSNARQRQVEALLRQQGIEEFDREHAVTAREKQAAEARLNAVVAEICEQQGHVWKGRVCANCKIRWEDVADRA